MAGLSCVPSPRDIVTVRQIAAQVGCLHGSHAAGRDVQAVLEEVRPGAVVVELCESSHKALRQDLEKKAKVRVRRSVSTPVRI